MSCKPSELLYSLSTIPSSMESFLDVLERYFGVTDVSIPLVIPGKAATEGTEAIIRELLADVGYSQEEWDSRFGREEQEAMTPHDVLQRLQRVLSDVPYECRSSCRGKAMDLVKMAQRQVEVKRNPVTKSKPLLDAFPLGEAIRAFTKICRKAPLSMGSLLLCKEDFVEIPTTCMVHINLGFPSAEEAFDHYDVDGDGFLALNEFYPLFVDLLRFQGLTGTPGMRPRSRALSAGRDLVLRAKEAMDRAPPILPYFVRLYDAENGASAFQEIMESFFGVVDFGGSSTMPSTLVSGGVTLILNSLAKECEAPNLYALLQEEIEEMVQKRTKKSEIMMTKVMIITVNAIMEGLELVEGGSQEMTPEARAAATAAKEEGTDPMERVHGTLCDLHLQTGPLTISKDILLGMCDEGAKDVVKLVKETPGNQVGFDVLYKLGMLPDE